jgi:hypothetical protein
MNFRMLIVLLLELAPLTLAQSITFNTNFEDASLGKIEKLDEQSFRCHTAGQSDERGRNRQANWYYFRMDHVNGRDLTITLTDFVGEYNDTPGAVAMNASIRPFYSEDDHAWKPIEQMQWDDQKKEATLHVHCNSDSIWIAHLPPYTTSHLQRLIDELDARPHVLVETIGKSVNGRDLFLLSITNPAIPESEKKVLWLIARQHAWETGTSNVMEGALRFISSDDPQAVQLRDKIIFKAIPMMDPDGCATGKVRFNANGYDVNRHWDHVSLHSKEDLRLMPEIWYAKRAIFAWVESGRPIDLMLNLHNTESTEFLETNATDAASRRRMQKLFDLLSDNTTFDPSRPLVLTAVPTTTTNSLYAQKKIPVLLMEQRITAGKKLGRAASNEDRQEFGKQLVQCMADAAE